MTRTSTSTSQNDRDLGDASAGQEYLLQEAGNLQIEGHLYVEHIERNERNALLASGAIWAWLLTGAEPRAPLIANWAPVAVTLLLTAKRVSLFRSRKRLSEYLQRTATALGVPDTLGFGQHLKHTSHTPFLGGWTVLYWLALLVTNLVIALLLHEGQ